MTDGARYYKGQYYTAPWYEIMMTRYYDEHIVNIPDCDQEDFIFSFRKTEPPG